MKNQASPTELPVRHGTAVVSAIAGMTVGAAVAANAARDALFLDVFSASDLPWVMIPSAIATLFFALVASGLLRWLGPNVFAPLLYVLCGGGVISTLFIAPASAEVAAVFLYLMVAAIVGSLMPAMWAMLNERYDPTSGKAAFARIAWMGTIGSVLGGLIAERVAKYLGNESVLIGVGGVFLFAGLGLVWVARAWPTLPSVGSSESTEQQPVARRYLLALAALTLTLALGEQFVDYLFKEAASNELSGEGLLRFFAVFYAAVGLVGFLGQVSITPRLLDALGPGKTSAFVPFALIGGALGGFFLGPLVAGSAVRASRGVAKTVFHRASYELFFVPIPTELKRSSKMLIDVGATSLGGVGGGALLAWFLRNDAVPSTLYGVVIVIALVQLGAVVAVSLAYVNSLAHSVVAQVGAMDHSKSLALRSTTVKPLEADLEELEAAFDRAPDVRGDLFQLLRDRQDADAIRKALSEPLDSAFLPLVIDLLSWDAVSEQAKRQLASHAPRNAGQLADALLDMDRPFAVRRRAAQVLAHAPAERAVPVLIEGLSDPEFEVRHRCARSLARHRLAGAEIPPEDIKVALLEECALSEGVREARKLIDAADEDSLPVLAGDNLQHTFTLLACILPFEPVQSTLVSIQSGDPSARGTGLEYLQQALDPDVRAVLLPLVEQHYVTEMAS